MAEPPEFPQESPAMKYVIQQVSRIEDAQACGTGYYRSLQKLIARQEKTDQVLNQLNQSTTALLKVTDSRVIATCIGEKTDEINRTMREGMQEIRESNAREVSTKLAEISYRYSEISTGFVRQMNEITATNKKLNSEIATVSNCLVITSGRFVLWILISLGAGVLIGRFL